MSNKMMNQEMRTNLLSFKIYNVIIISFVNKGIKTNITCFLFCGKIMIKELVRAPALAQNRDVSGAQDSEGGTYETFIKPIKPLNPRLRAIVRARARCSVTPRVQGRVRAET